MKRHLVIAVLAAAATALAPLALSTAASAGQTAHGGRHSKTVCGIAAAGRAACLSKVRTDGHGSPLATRTYSSGYSPSQLRTAYGISGSGSTLVAIVDAYASPNAAADLAAYRSQFGLGTAKLTQVNESGGSISSVRGNTGWGSEEMLDLEMVSSMCPTCSILYVGASSTSFTDLGTAVDTAVAKGAKVVSNSYGGSESTSDSTIAAHYNHPGVAITVSSGDSGYGVQSPASFGTVVAVGGTSLTLNSNATRRTETVWNGAGSGCSTYQAKPAWQHDPGCAKRTLTDVSAVADPNTGVAVYDSYGSHRGLNWYVYGGTSVAAPIIGGIYGTTGDTAGYPAQKIYASASSLFDVTSGSNGSCGQAYLCTGGAGYDGPTGNGTPNGTAAF